VRIIPMLHIAYSSHIPWDWTGFFGHHTLLEAHAFSSGVSEVVFKVAAFQSAALLRLPLPASVVHGLSSMFMSSYVLVFNCFKTCLDWKGLDFHGLWITLYDCSVFEVI